MLRHRVIPVVLLDGYAVLKTIGFKVRRNLGNPVTVARIYNSRNVDELILLDIDASKQKRCIDFFTVEDVASECFMPLAVGGGIRTSQEIEKLLKKGADKIIINTAALEMPELIRDFSGQFGSQCIIVSVDVQKPAGSEERNVFSHAGAAVPSSVSEWCQLAEAYGAGELFLNSVDQDGKMQGYDLELIKTVCSSIRIPVIACGGAGNPRHVAEAVTSGASAAAAASIFHFTDFTPEDCRQALRESGIATR